MKRKVLGGLLGCMLVGQVFAADSDSDEEQIRINSPVRTDAQGSGLVSFCDAQQQKYTKLRELSVIDYKPKTHAQAFLVGLRAVPSVWIKSLASGRIWPEAYRDGLCAYAESIQPEGYYSYDAGQRYRDFLQFGTRRPDDINTWLDNIACERACVRRLSRDYEYQDADYEAAGMEIDREIIDLTQSKIADENYSLAPRVWANFLSVAIPTAAVGLGVAVKSYWPQISSMMSDLLVKKVS